MTTRMQEVIAGHPRPDRRQLVASSKLAHCNAEASRHVKNGFEKQWEKHNLKLIAQGAMARALALGPVATRLSPPPGASSPQSVSRD